MGEAKTLERIRGIFTKNNADDDSDGMITRQEFLAFCQNQAVKDAFDALELPVYRPGFAARFFDVLDPKGLIDGVSVQDIIHRTSEVKAEGQDVNNDATLLLIDVRSLSRSLGRIEAKLAAIDATAEDVKCI